MASDSSFLTQTERDFSEATLPSVYPMNDSVPGPIVRPLTILDDNIAILDYRVVYLEKTVKSLQYSAKLLTERVAALEKLLVKPKPADPAPKSK